MPSLVTRKTNLKSLKYNQSGGDKQPYIQTSIPTGDLAGLPFDDGLIRGGTLLAAKSSITDTIRIGKFLTDLPKGPLFIAKQVGLQLSNPRLQTKKIEGSFTGDKNYIGPTRIYNLGINTLAQIPVNAFGVHFNRHGLLPVQDDNTKYLNVTEYNSRGQASNNRLVRLTSKFTLGDQAYIVGKSYKEIIQEYRQENAEGRKNARELSKQNPKQSAVQFVRAPKPIKPTFDTLTIDKYIGGPGSVYGIGTTRIPRYDDTENGNKIKFALERSYQFAGQSMGLRGEPQVPNYEEAIGITPNISIINHPEVPVPAVEQGMNLFSSNKNVSGFKVTNERVQAYIDIYNKLSQQIDLENTNNMFGIVGGFYDETTGNNISSYNVAPIEGIEYKNTYGDVVKIKADSWFNISREKRIGSGRKDEINLTPIFNTTAGTIRDTVLIDGNLKNINDLVKFRIQAIKGDDPNNNDWMIFRAYLTQFSDSTNATWNPVKYAGRGEDFYIYNGFSRKIQIGFKVAALSAEEMRPMYQKLNYLMGNLMPDYNDKLMRGPLVRMTVGNWLDGQDGILNDISYTVPEDSPWEIGLIVNGGKEPLILPHVVEVNMSFTPIGSQTKGKNLVSKKSYNTSHLAQNINDTQYITGSIPAVS